MMATGLSTDVLQDQKPEHAVDLYGKESNIDDISTSNDAKVDDNLSLNESSVQPHLTPLESTANGLDTPMTDIRQNPNPTVEHTESSQPDVIAETQPEDNSSLMAPQVNDGMSDTHDDLFDEAPERSDSVLTPANPENQPEVKSSVATSKDPESSASQVHPGTAPNGVCNSSPKVVSLENSSPSTPSVKSVHERPNSLTEAPPSKRPRTDETGKMLTREQSKYCTAILRQLKKNRDAGPFLHPVDPVKLNIPTYPEVVKEPMDLSMMQKKLDSGEYGTLEEFSNDMKLIVNNSRLFNGPDHKVTQMAMSLESTFEKQMQKMPSEPVVKEDTRSSLPPPKKSAKKKKAPPPASKPSAVPRRESIDRPRREVHPPPSRDLPYNDVKPRRKKYINQMKFCGQVLKELNKKVHEAYAYPFYLPVDPVALNIPDYYKVVKHPMDLTTIQNKLNNNHYETPDEFESDIRLMFRNCYNFNPVGTPVHNMGKRLEAVFDKKWQEIPEEQPMSYSPHGDSDESDAANDESIVMLERQLSLMKDQISMMKDKKRRDKDQRRMTKPHGKSSSKKGEKKSKSERSNFVSFEQKKELSEKINNITESKLQGVIRLIQEGMPHLKTADSDEIELDLDALTPDTLYKLYHFVCHDAPQPKIKPTQPLNPKKSRQVLSEAEQARRISTIEEQLQKFQSGEGGIGAPAEDSESESGSESSSEESD